MHKNRQSQPLPKRRSNDDTSELLTLQRKSKSNRDSNTNVRSSSYGNLTDGDTIEFMYRTNERRSIKRDKEGAGEMKSEDGAGDTTTLVKRTKSFWRFGKSDDDILAGMALWKHRDLVLTENEKIIEKKKETTLKRQSKAKNESGSHGGGSNNKSTNSSTGNNMIVENNNKNLSHSNSTSSSETIVNTRTSTNEDAVINHAKYPITKSEIDHRISKIHNEENIYGVSDTEKRRSIAGNDGRINGHRERDFRETHNRDSREHQRESRDHQRESRDMREHERRDSREHDHHRNSHYYDDDMNDNMDDEMSLLNNNSIQMQDTNFYDDESLQELMVMKTVKRKDILKQYYSTSGTDTEHNSSSSDPYDCIVVQDHLVRKGGDRKNINTNNNINLNNNKNHEKMEFSTFRSIENKNQEEPTSRPGTLLPRTKLSKGPSNFGMSPMEHNKEHDYRDGGNTDTQKRNGKNRSNQQHNNTSNNNNSSKAMANNKSYGPWYDLWGNDPALKSK